MNMTELCKLMHQLVLRKFPNLQHHHDEYWINVEDNSLTYSCALCSKKIMNIYEFNYNEKIKEHALEHFKEYNLAVFI